MSMYGSPRSSQHSVVNIFQRDNQEKPMNKRSITINFILIAVLAAAGICLAKIAVAEGPRKCIPDKALCAEMIRFGNQAYMRGKYLDAKEFFRKAVRADPASQKAWQHYDLAIIFALAEKTEKNTSLIAPDVSNREESGSIGIPLPPVTPPEKQGTGETEFKIVEDEGC